MQCVTVAPLDGLAFPAHLDAPKEMDQQVCALAEGFVTKEPWEVEYALVRVALAEIIVVAACLVGGEWDVQVLAQIWPALYVPVTELVKILKPVMGLVFVIRVGLDCRANISAPIQLRVLVTHEGRANYLPVEMQVFV